MTIDSIGPLGTPELIIIFSLVVTTVYVGIVPFSIICNKAALSPWLSLIILIPLGAIVLPFMLAIMEWPSLKQHS